MTPSSTEPSGTAGVAFTLDSASFPSVKLTLRGALGLRDAETMTKAIQERVFARKEAYTLLIDATHAGVPGADVRRHFAEFSIKNRAHTRGYCKGEAYVMPNALVRGALTAVMWLSPFEYPHKVVGTVNEARAWLDAQST
mgnify:CR=1 FL=1